MLRETVSENFPGSIERTETSFSKTIGPLLEFSTLFPRDIRTRSFRKTKGQGLVGLSNEKTLYHNPHELLQFIV